MAHADPLSLTYKPVSKEDSDLRARCIKRWRELDTEYQTWRLVHEDIIDFIQPNHGQFLQVETNRGWRKDGRVINNTAADRARKLTAAIDVGVCSEAREWWIAQLENAALMENRGAREYCHDFQEAMFAFIDKAGFYAPNRNAIEDAVGPAIGLVLIEEDDKTVARCTHVPIGQYRVGADARGEVNVVVRVFTYTASQMAEEFGAENCSIACRQALKDERTQTAKFTVLHVIEERPSWRRTAGKVDSANMPWASIWLELGAGYAGTIVPGQSETGAASSSATGILRESGYHEQPFYCYRWNAIGQNAYGTDSPGWNGLGDAKALQDMELGSATMLALIMRPPMNQPDALANASLLPGAMNPIPSDAVGARFEPSFTVDPKSVTVAATEKREVESRLNNTFFGDILFILSGNTNVEPKTAEEIRGIKEERLLQLGGVFARISAQLRVALRRLAGIAHRANQLPPAPPELLRAGKMRIDFVNPLVTAQKAIGYQGIQQVINLAVQVAEAQKAGADKLDGDEILDTGADMLGVKPNILLSDEVLKQRRQAVSDKANAQAQAQSMPEAAGALKDMSSVDPDKLRQLLQQFSPNAAAQGATQGA